MGADKIIIDLNLSNDLILLIDDLGLSKSINDNIAISIAIALVISKSVSLARTAERAKKRLSLCPRYRGNRHLSYGLFR